MKYLIMINYEGEIIKSKKCVETKEEARILQNMLIDLFEYPVGILEVWEKGDNKNGRKKKII